MAGRAPKHLYLPARDRSFWKCDGDANFPLLYLAWGHRNFHDQVVPPSAHEGWVVVCIEEGNPTIRLQGRAIRLAPGQLAFIREDCAFGWQPAGPLNCKFLLWMWRRPLHPQLAALPTDTSTIYKLPAAQRALWHQLHTLCREEMFRQDDFSPGWLESCQRQLEILLLRLINPAPDEKPAARRIALALEWMRQHPESQEPVSRLCDYLDVSQPTLHRLFKSQTGETPLVHFHRIKMQQARS
ncbi:MAG: AraC family transcriptional regulator, partial [Verrucomicrobia bacterium]|nr:AraC family transcriptional regulator [Verrucomicrobiota bacterium]